MPAQRTTKKQQPAQQSLLGFNARSRASSTSAVKKQPAPSSSIKSRSTKASRTKAAAVVELDSSSSSSETNGDGIADAEEALAELEGRKKTSDRKGSQVVQPAAGDELKPNDPKWNKCVVISPFSVYCPRTCSSAVFELLTDVILHAARAYKEARAHLGGQKPSTFPPSLQTRTYRRRKRSDVSCIFCIQSTTRKSPRSLRSCECSTTTPVRRSACIFFSQCHPLPRADDDDLTLALFSGFGPSTSIDRLARWERANKWGLNPPAYVCSLLSRSSSETSLLTQASFRSLTSPGQGDSRDQAGQGGRRDQGDCLLRSRLGDHRTCLDS